MKLTKKYLKNLIVEEYEKLKEEGLVKQGANPLEIQKKIFEYTTSDSSKFLWRQTRSSFFEMASGGSAEGLREDYYPHWKNEDFYQVIEGISNYKKSSVPIDQNLSLFNKIESMLIDEAAQKNDILEFLTSNTCNMSLSEARLYLNHVVSYLKTLRENIIRNQSQGLLVESNSSGIGTVSDFFEWFAGEDWKTNWQTTNSMFINETHAQDDGLNGLSWLNFVRNNENCPILVESQKYEDDLYINRFDINGLGMTILTTDKYFR